MIKRYIVDKKALNVVSVTTLDAQTELASSKIITNEPLEFKNIPYISLMLDEVQVKALRDNNIFYEEEIEILDTPLMAAQYSGYEKIRARWDKAAKRGITGKGCKVGVMDTGCNQAVVPWAYGVNFVEGNTDVTDVYGHGTIVCSIIKHPVIAVAPDCELHMIKTINNQGSIVQSAVLAGVDYAIDNELDVINLSWRADTVAIREALIQLAEGNCVVAAAAGNDGVETTTSVPACLPGIVAVNSISYDGYPGNRNILARGDIAGSHGITIACNGVSCQSYNAAGNYQGCWGTSCACPFFVGTFAIYKELLGISDNKKVLEYVLDRAKRTSQPNYFGVGTPSF